MMQINNLRCKFSFILAQTNIMKKNTFLIISFLLISCISFSQAKKDSILKLMAKDVCDELNKKEMIGKSKEDLQVELGLALMPVFSKYKDQIKEIYGFEEIDSESGYVIGKDIGMQLAYDCPAFMKIFINNSEAVTEIVDKKKTKDLKLTGILQKINNADISYIETKDVNGKIEKLYWLEYFEGSNNLISEPNKFINKKITFTYTEKEVYKSSLKEYSKIKVITGMKTE